MEHSSFASETRVAFYYGSRTVLQKESWHEKNVSLPLCRLYYITDGTIAIETGGKTLTVNKGEMALIPPNRLISYFIPEGDSATAVKYWMHFDVSMGGANAFDALDFDEKIEVSDPGLVTRLYETAIERSASSSPADAIAVAGATALLISYFFERAHVRRRSDEPDELDVAVRAAGAPGEKPTLPELAARAHLSPNYFIRRFREKTGMPPMRFVNNLKIERAKSLLENTDLPIGEIMQEVGFSDPAYFSRLFRSRTGCSPRTFRKIYSKR